MNQNLRHIAIIMDGNGRWAQSYNLPRFVGHQKGAKTVEKIIDYALSLDLAFLSLFAFSCENWKRPQQEVEHIFRLVVTFISTNIKKIVSKNIKVSVIGRRDNLPSSLLKKLEKIEAETKNNDGMYLQIAFNYSGRDEIVRAARSLMEASRVAEFSAQELDEVSFAKFLDTKDVPDPDLIIRTSGEMRLSNFMLWQVAYSELYFCNCFWPDFTAQDLDEAVKSYYKRKRRFGNINNNELD